MGRTPLHTLRNARDIHRSERRYTPIRASTCRLRQGTSDVVHLKFAEAGVERLRSNRANLTRAFPKGTSYMTLPLRAQPCTRKFGFTRDEFLRAACSQQLSSAWHCVGAVRAVPKMDGRSLVMHNVFDNARLDSIPVAFHVSVVSYLSGQATPGKRSGNDNFQRRSPAFSRGHSTQCNESVTISPTAPQTLSASNSQPLKASGYLNPGDLVPEQSKKCGRGSWGWTASREWACAIEKQPT
ncbi:hypothetical protein C8Q73DRAFT_186732 [Cubamyces lactineus]|nr:hypothetical protein C8Q73DRAFT_186732 [Cubamyces lactineus]